MLKQIRACICTFANKYACTTYAQKRVPFFYFLYSSLANRYSTNVRTFAETKKRVSRTIMFDRFLRSLLVLKTPTFFQTPYFYRGYEVGASILMCSSLLSLRSFAFYEPVFTVLIDDVHTRKSIEIGYSRKDDNNVANMAIIGRSNRTRCNASRVSASRLTISSWR